MDVWNSGKLKMQSKEAMCCISHYRGYHSAKSQNVIDALTFSCVVSSLTKLSFYHFLFVFTLLLFCWYRSRIHSLVRSLFSSSVSRVASFSFGNVFLMFLWFAASHFFREICWFRRVARSYRLLGKRSFLAACCYELKTKEGQSRLN